MSKRVKVTLLVTIVGIVTLGAWLNNDGLRATNYTDSTSYAYTEYNMKGVYFGDTGGESGTQANVIYFAGGNDSIQMYTGNDNIYMGAGNNGIHFGESPSDTGADQIRMNGGADQIAMGSGADAIYMGGDDGDKLSFATGTEITNDATNSVLTVKSTGDLVIQLGS